LPLFWARLILSTSSPSISLKIHFNVLGMAVTCLCTCIQVGWWKGWRMWAIYLFNCGTFSRCHRHTAFSVWPVVPTYRMWSDTTDHLAWQLWWLVTVVNGDSGEGGDCGEWRLWWLKVCRVGLPSAADPTEAAHRCVVLWEETFLNTEFVFCVTTSVSHLPRHCATCVCGWISGIL
jgi:hypothetical protein